LVRTFDESGAGKPGCERVAEGMRIPNTVPSSNVPAAEGADMKEFKCGAIVPGCEHVFEGESDSAILDQIGDHARDAHGMHEVPPEVIDSIVDNISERVSA
jgi:predicted small metal-binding protein